MRTALIVIATLCAVPLFASAAPEAPALASFSAAQSLTTASSSPGNAYVAGMSVIVTAPVAGDLSVCGGSAVIAAPVAGDGLLLAGSVSSRANVGGDLRAIGGSVDVLKPVHGDIFSAGFAVRDEGRAGGSVFIVAANVTIADGAAGPVTVYGNNVTLAGVFDHDVRVVASGHISLAPDTVIHGTLAYESPETADIPDSAIIDTGVVFTNASYLPDPGTSHVLAFISMGFFAIARIVSAIILAGLLAGLFPGFAEAMLRRVRAARTRSVFLTLLLGLAVAIATPVVMGFLALTFVGISLAILLFMLYTLSLLLAFVYAGIMLGGFVVRQFTGRTNILWHDGVLGMALVSLVSLIPYVGLPALVLLTLFALGSLLQFAFAFAFPHAGDDDVR